MALNGFEGPQHRRVRTDVLQYLEESRDGGWLYDLIVLDPPSFSNSKKMQGVLDIQRDHRWLVETCLDMLHPGGVLYFSNNLRTFKLDAALEPLCTDITLSRYLKISATSAFISASALNARRHDATAGRPLTSVAVSLKFGRFWQGCGWL